jgi:hypothetical protein
MQTPRPRARFSRAGVVRGVSLAIVALAVAGLVSLNSFGKQSADAATATSSAVTVKWLSDDSSVAAVQPPRDATSPHYNEMKNLSITVSQTSGLIDQAVSVSVKDFATGVGTRDSTRVAGSSVFASNAQNFLQAMQCWGEPTAGNFRQTCQWGGRYTPSGNNGLGSSAFPDTTMRVGTIDADPNKPNDVDNPFLKVQGGKPIPGKPISGKYEILDYFNPATSNEVTTARVGVDGTGSFDFEPQTADTAPQLGCGTEGHLRCWLVVVPRGTFFGGDAKCSQFQDPAGDGSTTYTKWQKNALQAGSPINPNCDYWDNRVVVPLDFAPVGSTCAVGSTEQRVIGSQLMVGAMSSWQPALCTKQKTTYSFSTNPDSVARHQLLEGQATVAYSSQPLSPGEQTTNESRQTLATTKLSYAPVAVSGVAVAFLAEFDEGRQTSLNLSPRLVAKLLTQSYGFQIPVSTSDDPLKPVAHLTVPKNVSRPYRLLSDDPEFQKLNPDNARFFQQSPSIVLPGPSGADAVRQVWKWLEADKDAAAFLAGTPDEWGMGVNPYYLPFGDAKAKVPTFDAKGNFVLDGDVRALAPVGLKNIDDSPLSLATVPLDTFFKADLTKAPLAAVEKQRPFDSIQFAPYVDNMLNSARTAFRADPNSKTIWDPSKFNQAGDKGDWVSSGAQEPGKKFMIAITDTPSAARYGLNIASIQPANSSTLTNPTKEGLSTALVALRPTSDERVTQVDPSAVAAPGYPLTVVTYADVNLTLSTAANRKSIANLITQVTTTGQVPGTEPGQLPAGYLPITAAMADQAAKSVAAIRAFIPANAVDSSTDSSTPETGDYNGGSISAFDDSGAIAGGAAAGDPTTSTVAAIANRDARTPSAPDNVLVRSGLALSLGVGAAGALFAPLLFKRRGFL